MLRQQPFRLALKALGDLFCRHRSALLSSEQAQSRLPTSAPAGRGQRLSAFVVGGIGLLCQLLEELEELVTLADEKPVIRQAVQGVHSGTRRRSGTNNRTRRELPAEEHCWLGHDQVGLKILPTKGRRVQVRESHRDTGHGIDDVF